MQVQHWEGDFHLNQLKKQKHWGGISRIEVENVMIHSQYKLFLENNKANIFFFKI